MQTAFQKVKETIRHNPKKWLITGVAGFIGSNLLEKLLKLDQHVVGIDNFSTGSNENLEEVKELVGEKYSRNFQFIEGDIRKFSDCQKIISDVHYVLHLAALGSVPRSINDPITTNENNVSGFLNMIVAAKDEGVESFT